MVADFVPTMLRIAPSAKMFYDEARRLLTIESPDWDVPSTEELEKEVSMFSDRVEEQIKGADKGS